MKAGRKFGYCKPGLEAKEHPTIKDIYWAAGIYEGEGCCQLVGESVHVNIAQVDKWLLKRMTKLFGGNISNKKSYNKNWSPACQWQIYGARGRGFLMTIYSLLSPRRKKQIKKALNVKV